MAIDTAAKRSSVLGTKLPFKFVLPFPSGSIAAAQRQAIVGAYNGIPASNPTPPPTGEAIILGIVMVELGLTILEGVSPNLYKGLVQDQLNLIKQ